LIGGAQIGKNCDVILVIFFGDVMVMTSKLSFEVRFRQN